MSNLPDDIALYDTEPASPFFKPPPQCEDHNCALDDAGECEMCHVEDGRCYECGGTLAVRVTDGSVFCADCEHEVDKDKIPYLVVTAA